VPECPMPPCKDACALRHLDYPRIFPQGRVTDRHYRKAITNQARNSHVRAGPVTMGRIPRGPPGRVRTWDGETSS
jgi:hypothetical protein